MSDMSIKENARSRIKLIIRALRLGRAARAIRGVFCYIFDMIGEAAFFMLRCLRIVTWPQPFNASGVKKILIVRMDRIGDLIVSTPAIRAVRSGFNKAEIHILVSAYNKDLVINNPNVNRVLVYGEDRIANDYDTAIILHPGIRENYAAFASGARWRVGFIGGGGGFFLTHKLKDDREIRRRHEVESALEVVAVIGCATDNKKMEISVTPEGERFAEVFFARHNLAGRRVVIMHPGARQPHVRWKAEGFAEVANRLIAEKGVKIILTAGASEKQLVERITASMAEKPICVQDVALRDLVSLIKRCAIYIGNITGPMHIAAALDVPVVAIAGVIHPLDSYEEWGPRGENHIAVKSGATCAHCHPSDCSTYKCMEAIKADDVFEAAVRQLSRNTGPGQ